jgi:hypothetical protein
MGILGPPDLQQIEALLQGIPGMGVYPILPWQATSLAEAVAGDGNLLDYMHEERPSGITGRGSGPGLLHG